MILWVKGSSREYHVAIKIIIKIYISKKILSFKWKISQEN